MMVEDNEIRWFQSHASSLKDVCMCDISLGYLKLEKEKEKIII